MQDLIFRNEVLGEVVIISGTVVILCASFRNDRFEAGGVLIGNRRDSHFEIVDATPPFRDDTRSYARFIRCDAQHNLLLAKQWEKSGRSLTYLGDWHTHPEDHPTPSPTDLSEWKKLRDTLQVPLVFLIFGRRSAAAWLVGHDGVTRLSSVVA
jgi:integrative and conjugative element protein (TIGR02256 family)